MPIFRRNRFPDFDFNIGTGAEYILITADSVVFSCAGVLQRVGIIGPGDKSEGLWKIESHVEGETSLLYQGDYYAVSKRFSLISHKARGNSSPNKTILTAIFAALIGAVSVFAIEQTMSLRRFADVQPQPAEIDFAELVDALRATGMDYSQILPAIAERSGMSPEELIQLRRQTIEPIPSQSQPTGVGPDQPKAEAPSALPKYDPSMYAGNDALEGPSKPGLVPGADVDKVDAESTAPGDLMKDEIETQLKALPADEAAAALRQLSMLKPEQMQGAALDGLPESIKKIIMNAQMDKPEPEPAPGIQTTDEAGVPTKLIILPPTVIDQFRTHDGIASIPENSSWQARGNPTVRLPLPGGGDIQSVTDLEKFGFKP